MEKATLARVNAILEKKLDLVANYDGQIVNILIGRISYEDDRDESDVEEELPGRTSS